MIHKSKHASQYTVIPNEFKYQDLSLTAIGLLTYLISLPYDWVVYKQNIYKNFPESRQRIDEAWSQLVEKGYVMSVQKMDSKGRFKGYEHSVYDVPFNDESRRIPVDGLPAIGKPAAGNPTTTKERSTNSINTNKKNIENEFLSFFKNKTLKEVKPNKKLSLQLGARIKEGYTLEDLKKALVNFLQTEYHKNKPDWITTIKATTSDFIERNLNSTKNPGVNMDEFDGRAPMETMRSKQN